MNGRTHFMIGASVGLAFAAQLGASAEPALIMTAAACLGAALPDIDHPSAGLRQRLGFLGRIVFGWLKHRTLTHSLLALVAVTALGLRLHSVYGAAFGLGYASHILADMVTYTGVPILYPLIKRSIHILPGFLRMTTGGLVERFVLALASGVVFWYALQLSGVLTQTAPLFIPGP